MVIFQLVQAAIWDVFAMCFVEIAAPFEVVETEFKFAEDDSKLLEYFNASADDLWADAIRRNGRDSVDSPLVEDVAR